MPRSIFLFLKFSQNCLAWDAELYPQFTAVHFYTMAQCPRGSAQCCECRKRQEARVYRSEASVQVQARRGAAGTVTEGLRGPHTKHLGNSVLPTHSNTTEVQERTEGNRKGRTWARDKAMTEP